MKHTIGSKKIVLTSWGSFGDLHPYMAIAAELIRRGHQAAIATMPFYREKIESAGIGFYPVRPDFPPIDQAQAIVRRAIDAREGPRYIFGEMIAPYVRQSYEDTLAAVRANGGADLLVTHMITLGAPLVAEKTGIRWVSTVLAPIAFISAYDPPSPPHFPALRRLIAGHPTLARFAIGMGKRHMRSWVKPVAELRKDLGLPPGKHPIFEGQHSPTCVLGLFSSVLSAVQPDFPPHTRITGFAFYDESERPIAPELQNFLDSGEPPILFTLGSSAVFAADDFYSVSIEAARRLKKRALLLVGKTQAPPMANLPPDIAAFDYAPYATVMPRVSCIVHQGGVGTTGQTLRSGRPALVMPFGHDTPDNARRCVELGVARVLPRTNYKADRVAQELSELLSNPGYTQRAQVIGRQVQSEHGTATACDVIEEVLGGIGDRLRIRQQ